MPSFSYDREYPRRKHEMPTCRAAKSNGPAFVMLKAPLSRKAIAAATANITLLAYNSTNRSEHVFGGTACFGAQ